MARLKLKDLREKSVDELLSQLVELKGELTKLKIDAAKGTLRKDTGRVKYYRRDIARILTILREKGKKL